MCDLVWVKWVFLKAPNHRSSSTLAPLERRQSARGRLTVRPIFFLFFLFSQFFCLFFTLVHFQWDAQSLQWFPFRNLSELCHRSRVTSVVGTLGHGASVDLTYIYNTYIYITTPFYGRVLKNSDTEHGYSCRGRPLCTCALEFYHESRDPP